MNEYDGYVEDYLIKFFKNMPSAFIPRDIDLENQIILACKIEYSIRIFPKETITQILGGTTLSIKDSDGKIWNIIARKDCNGYFELRDAGTYLVPSVLRNPWREFGYNLENHFPPLGLHFIDAYRIIKNIDRYSAIAELAELFNLNAEKPIHHSKCQQIFKDKCYTYSIHLIFRGREEEWRIGFFIRCID